MIIFIDFFFPLSYINNDTVSNYIIQNIHISEVEIIVSTKILCTDIFFSIMPTFFLY